MHAMGPGMPVPTRLPKTVQVEFDEFQATWSTPGPDRYPQVVDPFDGLISYTVSAWVGMGSVCNESRKASKTAATPIGKLRFPTPL